METWYIGGRNVDEAREEIFRTIQQNRGKNVIYIDGWDGLGSAAVIRSIAQVLQSTKARKTHSDLCFDRVIYIDCSAWISERVMQRKIAEELELDHETISMFDKQDEEDDFDGVDQGSRDVIPQVSKVITQTLVSSSFIMAFLNGSDHEIDVSKFGIIPNYLDHVVLWTFKRRALSIHDKWDDLKSKLRYTHVLTRWVWRSHELQTSQFCGLLRREVDVMVAPNPCMQGIDPKVVTDWCLYCLFLHYCFHGTDRVCWAAQAPNFCLYDGINKSYITREIRDALHREINWDCDASILKKVFADFMEDPDSPFLIIKDDTTYKRKPYRWICISTTTKNTTLWEEMEIILATASSLFMVFESSMWQQRLPHKIFEQCSFLQVLILSRCTFSFVLPPFLKCHTLRFLGVDHCSDDKILREEESSTEWTFLHNLWVLDIRHTHWDRIISLDKIDLMANLQELNIEGFCCWQYTNTIQGRLPDLHRLRITQPTQQAETSVNSSSNLLMDRTKLEILDLSGNRDMKNLPAGLSNASNLQVLILDGCNDLENVVSNGLPSSLRSFSFDGYGPASHWTPLAELPPKGSHPKSASDPDKKDAVKISKISLQGCKQLENLFVCGLPNLEELDLSGSPIKVLDFETMVANVPRLRRLFLLGCQHLRAIRWGSFNSKGLDVVCVDTRPGMESGFKRPPLSQYKKDLQLHAVLADARLCRSFGPLCINHEQGNISLMIHITSSTENCGVVQLEATTLHHAPPRQYGDVLTDTIGDVPLVAFPKPPTQQLDCHVQIGDGSLSLDSELEVDPRGVYNLAFILRWFAQSLHMHDVVTNSSMPSGDCLCLRWCRVERCPNLETIFRPGTVDYYNRLETIWASDLLKARSIFSKGGRRRPSFGNLQDLHLCSCPRLQFVLPVWVSTFPSLKTIHIIHCGDLKHVFELDEDYPAEEVIQGVLFPKLTTIHLYDQPKLRQICEVKMLAPQLETVKIRGCFGLRRLPALEGREPGMKKPTVEIEKDVWDALKWDGLASGHHPNLYEVPVHSRHYRRSRLLRGTVLR